MEEKLSSEVLQNVNITLNTLVQQNRRLMAFQEMSYKWHLKHHQNIKNIIKGVNLIAAHLEMNDYKVLEPIENQELFQKPTANFDQNLFIPHYDYGKNLHDKVTSLLNKQMKDYNEVEDLIRKCEWCNIKELKEDSWELIFPIIEKWIKKKEDFRRALLLIKEVIQSFPVLFGKISNKVFARCFRDGIKNGVEWLDEINFEKKKANKMYSFFVSCL